MEERSGVIGIFTYPKMNSGQGGVDRLKKFKGMFDPSIYHYVHFHAKSLPSTG